MTSDEVAALRAVLADHHAAVTEAHSADPVDLGSVCEAHAKLCRILSDWDVLSVSEQRAVVRTIEHVVNLDAATPGGTGDDDAGGDLGEVRRLEAELGYV